MGFHFYAAMLSEKGSRVIALRGRTSGRALYCGRKVSSPVVRDAGGRAMWLSSGTRVTPQDDRMSLGVPVCVLRRAGRPWRSAAKQVCAVRRRCEKLWRPPRWGLAHEAFSMWVEVCFCQRCSVCETLGAADVTVGVIAQG